MSDVDVVSTSAATPLALIMKGGGVKGYSYLGALEVLQEKYQFNWYVGTSAGAIAAVLLGAGYTLDELKKILGEKDFRDFFDASRRQAVRNLSERKGLYSAKSLTNWLDDLLAKKLNSFGQVKLGHLPTRVTIYASRRNQAAVKYDSETDANVLAATAVRLSMSIPLVFIPEVVEGSNTYDGGIQNNYPVQAFLDEHSDTPFIGLYLGPQCYQSDKRPWFMDVYSICMEAGDVATVEEYREQTVVIDPQPIGTLDFGLTQDERDFLLASGREGALAHLEVGSERHVAAEAERDRLRKVVEKQRADARTSRRRRRWILGGLLLLVLLALLSWRLWPNPPRTSSITFPQFMAQFEATRDDPPRFRDFKAAYVDKQVTWKAVVLKVQDEELPCLRIVENISDGESKSLRANFEPEDFIEAKTLRPSETIRIQGIVSSDTSKIGPALRDCKLLRRVQ